MQAEALFLSRISFVRQKNAARALIPKMQIQPAVKDFSNPAAIRSNMDPIIEMDSVSSILLSVKYAIHAATGMITIKDISQLRFFCAIIRFV